MKEYAKAFYKSNAWEQCRAAYIKSVGGLCEDCLERGVYRPGVIVHHINHITPENIGNTSITLDWSNLRYVCRDCHAKEHSHTQSRRYIIHNDGSVSVCV